MRTTSQCSPGVRLRTEPTPSTWPCIRWPPRRVCGVTARSRLTGCPAAASARLLRRSVSAMTSVLQTPSDTPVTVRQTPLTAMESPSATSSSTRCARIFRTAATACPPAICCSRTTTVPTSSTMPVNTSAPPVRGLYVSSVPVRPQPHLQVPAQRGDVDDREGQRVADRTNSQVADQGRTGAQQLRGEMDHDLVDQAFSQERGGQGGAALEQHSADVAGEQLGQE